MSDAEPNDLILRFYDPKRPGVHTTPVSALAQSLEALQRLVHLTAMRREGRTPGRRIRPSADIQARYRLVCDIPTEGSYISPVRIEKAELAGLADTADIMNEVERLLEAVGFGDQNRFAATVPDETWRGFVLDALERVVPPPIAGVELEIRRSGRSLLNTVSARSFVERLARDTARKVVRGSVVGEFKRIDFARQELTIRHAETGRDLSCQYEVHVEESLLDHPRDLLLVFGSVTRDAEGQPLSIEDVDHIEPVDLSPLPVGPVAVGNVTVTPTETLSASVSFDESDAVYVADISPLNVSVFAETREMLTFALEDEIALLWKRYANAPDAKLTPAAQALKRRTLQAFRSSFDAA